MVPGLKTVAGTGDVVTPVVAPIPRWGVLLLKPSGLFGKPAA